MYECFSVMSLPGAIGHMTSFKEQFHTVYALCTGRSVLYFSGQLFRIVHIYNFCESGIYDIVVYRVYMTLLTSRIWQNSSVLTPNI